MKKNQVTKKQIIVGSTIGIAVVLILSVAWVLSNFHAEVPTDQELREDGAKAFLQTGFLRPTETTSSKFFETSEKIDFFKKYIESPSEILEANYSIDFESVNSYEIQAALFLPTPEDTKKWTEGLTPGPATVYNKDNFKDVPLVNLNFDPSFVREYYTANGGKAKLVAIPELHVILLYMKSGK